jgi:adenosylmethionine-8-amino-7-oxononanoate aminotransferase
MEVAIKMAFQYWRHMGRPEKSGFISFRNAYHGDTIGCMSVGGIDLYHEVFRPLLVPAILAPSPYCYRCELGGNGKSDECGLLCLKELESIMASNSDSLAGLVIEPLVQGAGGMIVQPEGFLRKVRQLCDRYDLLMIADEVAVGFGRTGTMFACEQEGITPDIMALSKGITAGYLPLAATLTTRGVYEAFLGEYREMKTFFHGHTFTGNPVACAAALASLRTLDGLKPKIDYLAQRLERIAELDHVGDVRQKGMIGGIELVRDKTTGAPYPWEERTGVRLCMEARRYGLFLRPLGNVIVVFPPLSISLEEMELLMGGIEASIRTVTG